MSELLFNEDGTIKIPENIKDEIPNFNSSKYKKFKSYKYNKNEKNERKDNGDNEFMDGVSSEDSDGLNNYNGYNNSDNFGIDGIAVDLENPFDEKQYNLEDDVSNFNLYEDGKKLEPLIFSNGKSQGQVVDEIIDKIKQGKKTIFVKGVCGTGKSAIALNVAKKLGKTSIVVPGKALQRQYILDYSGRKYVLKEDHRKLKIKVITGRDNHKCLFCDGCSADDSLLPCKIEIKEANLDKIKEYLSNNVNLPKNKSEINLRDIRRISIAPVCPYWSPIIPSDIEYPLESEKRDYKGIYGIKFNIYNRKKGCTYYNQFNSYTDSEVIVFNSAKYLLEMLMNRKPETEVDIIDECDEFLDSFSNVRRINFNRLLNSLVNINYTDDSLKQIARKLYYLIVDVIEDEHIKTITKNNEIIPVKLTKVFEILNYFIENSRLVEDLDEENYCSIVSEIAFDFENIFDDSYVSFSQEERGLVVNLASINLSRKFKELQDKNKFLILMSGTVHSEKVLKDVFGIDDFGIVNAEINNQGKIDIIRTGLEIDCRYDNLKKNIVSRENYLLALDKAVENAPRPTLVHINAFKDLPSLAEKEKYKLDALITKEKLIELQKWDKENKIVDDFKNKKNEILFTTKCSRGIDFPDEQCRSIVFTKYPNPDVSSIFWKILKQVHPNYYWEFYKDKAKRDFLQKIYRGVRSKKDFVYVLSPDLRVLNAINLCSF